MLKYSRGKVLSLKRFLDVLRFKLKCLRGFFLRYAIYRPNVDHTVYDEDNRKLLSTFKGSAAIYHFVSNPLRQRLNQYQIIEMEHPFSLVGHLDTRSDYRTFRQNCFDELKRFVSGFDPARHRIISNSIGGKDFLSRYLNVIGLTIPESSIHQIYWGLGKKRQSVQLSNNISVFHSGGTYPYSKGTKDVIDLARKFPSVKFYISVDLDSKLIKNSSLPNIEYMDVWSKAAYVKGLTGSSIFLLPIYGDGWGAPLEALSYAMPIIGYNTYDKSEIIHDQQNGFLIDIPPSLSFYDGFFDGAYRNWDEFNELVADSNNSKQLDAMCFALDAYCSSPQLIRDHSAAASEIFDGKFLCANRLAKVRQVYQELLNEMNTA